ncbi:MAG: PKD domain-containing protein [Bacteroidia bacterium]
MKRLLQHSAWLTLFMLGALFYGQAQVVLPYTEDFENVGPSKTFRTNQFAINGLGVFFGPAWWGYNRPQGLEARLRFNAGAGFAQSGTHAATLDDSVFNSVVSPNELILSVNLSSYSTQQVQLGFSYMHHGEDRHPGDSIWVRASFLDPWVGVYDLYQNRGAVGNYVTVQALNLSAIAAAKGQTLGQSTQIRFGQSDNGPAISTIATAGISLDDVNLSVVPPVDVGMENFGTLASGCGISTPEPITVEIKNYGSDTLKVIPLVIELNGGTPALDTFRGSIPASQTGTFTFTPGLPLGNFGTYTIRVWSNATGDADQANDTIDITITNFTVSSYPYVEGFENGDAGWGSTFSGLADSWALETPALTTISSAASGVNSWVTSQGPGATGSAGGYSNNEDSRVIASPCFDLSGMTTPFVRMDVWWNSQNFSDGTVLQSSIDGGVTWIAVGNVGTGTNWYTQAFINGNPGGQTLGWSGSVATNSGSQGWLTAEHPITNLAGQSDVRFRVAFASNAFTTDDGFAFDNFIIYETIPADGSATALISPSNGCNLGPAERVEVEITNNGTATLNTIPVAYRFNNNTAVIRDTIFNANLAPGATVTNTFPGTVNLGAVTTYDFKLWTEVVNDANFFNDTFATTVENYNTVSSFPYIQDFEFGAGGWNVSGRNATWELGNPTNTVINRAASGVNAWVTDLDGNHNNNELSFVQSPCFDFTSIPNPVIRMNIWWESWNNQDGAYFQSSTDGGVTWSTIGAIGSPINWYNSTAGWSGRNGSSNGSNGWVMAQQPLTGLGGNSSVLLKMVFESNAFTFAEGFGFDDVRIFDNSNAIDISILDFVTPSSNGCSTADSVRISYVNLGSSAITGASLTYSYGSNGSITNTVTETDPQTVPAGDTAIYTFTVPAVVSVPQQAYGFNGWLGLIGDFDPLNDSLLRDTFVNNLIIIGPNQGWCEDFETFTAVTVGFNDPGFLTNGWTRTPARPTPASWHVEVAPTRNSGNTGPVFDNTLAPNPGGIYMYTEASNIATGASVFLESPCLDLSTSNSARLEFAYHMYGLAMGSLITQVLSNNVWIPIDTIQGQQQTAETEPWRTRLLDLTPYAGQVIKVRFRGVDGNSFTGDMAIDDVCAYEVLPNDLGATAMLSPAADACFSNAETVDIEVTNLGSNVIDFTTNTIRVYVQMSGAGNKLDSVDITTGMINPLGTVTASISPFDMGAPGTYTFQAWTKFITGGPDSQISNDSMKVTDRTNFNIVVTPTSSYLEDFESFTPGRFFPASTNGLLANGWDRDPGDNIFQSWHVDSSAAQNTTNTGPIIDATFATRGQGYYMYVEPPFGAGGPAFVLISPCVDLTSTVGPRMDFAYHMFGNNMGTLVVDAFSAGTWTPLDSIIGQQQTAENDPWDNYTIDLLPYAGQIIKVRFRYYKTVTGTLADAAIDDVLFYQPIPEDAGVTDIISPIDSCGMTASESIRVRIKNFGTQPLDTIPVVFRVDGGTIMLDTMFFPIGPLAPNDDTAFTFTPTGDFSALGPHTIEAWTLVAPGDSNKVNDTAFATIENVIVVSTFPHFEDFDSGPGGWRVVGPNQLFEHGAPNGTVISTPYSSPNVWMTGLSTRYGNNEQAWVESPCFDMGTLLFPIVRSRIWYESRANAFRSDGAKLQYSTNNGRVWRDLGRVATDWYNDPNVTAFTLGGSEGWAGSNLDGNGSGGWLYVETLAPQLGFNPSVKFRYLFESDPFTSNRDGFAFDDFEIMEAPVDLRNLGMPASSGCDVTDTICIDVFNASAAIFNSVTATYSVNGGTPVSETFTVTVNPGDTRRICFAQLATFTSAQTYRIRTTISAAGDTIPKNDTITNDVLYSPLVNTFPYLEDFDSGSGGWGALSSSVDNSWVRTTPHMSVINTPRSAPNSWVTQGTTQPGSFSGYSNNECSWVSSPCFDFSNLNTPRVRVDVWWESENSFDGTVLQSTIDGGVTWQDVGVGSPNITNWYNNTRVLGLTNCGQNQNGWSGQGTFSGSNGWVQAEFVDLTGVLANEPQVQFRMYFGSDGSVIRNGFAFDNFYIDDLPINDLSSIEILSPRDGSCASANQDIIVVIRNEGSATQTRSPIRYRTGGPNNTFNWTGNLATNQYDTVNLGTFNSLGGGQVVVTVTTALPGDQIASNNTVVDTFDITPLPNAPTLQNDTIALCVADSTQLWVNNPVAGETYLWFDVNTGRQVGEGDTIQTTFLARDTAFDVQAATGMTGLKITEIETGFNPVRDFIEVQNMTGAPLDATGWTVYIADRNGQINTLNNSQWDLGAFAAGEVQFRDGTFNSPNYWGSFIGWGAISFSSGWAIIIDDNCEVVDFVIWGYRGVALTGFNPRFPSCPGVTYNLADFWDGPSLAATFPVDDNLQRDGTSDTDSDSDWLIAETPGHTQGVQNAGLQVGCLSPPSRIVVLIEPPLNINLQDQFICGPATVDAGPNFTSYLWSTGDVGQRVTLNDTITTVSVRVTDKYGCADSDTAVVESYEFPNLSLGADTIACGSIQLDGGTPGCDYIWSNGSNDRQITFNGRVGPNLVWAECIDPTTGCATRDSLNVDLLPLPDAGIPTVLALCDSGNVAVDPSVAGLPLLWSTTETTPSIDINTSNRYYVTLTDTANGCVGTDSIDITVNISPTVNLGPDVDACNGAELDAGIFGGFVFYDWNTTQVTRKINVSTSGQYIVTVTDFNQCKASDSVNVNILPPPTADWVTTPNPVSTSGLDLDFYEISTGPGLTFMWDFGDGTTSTQSSPNHVFQFAGNYIVCLTVTDSCNKTDEYCDTLNLPLLTTGISGVMLDNAIDVFPTPTRDFVNIRVNNLDTEVTMEVTDARGRLIYTEILPRTSSSVTTKVDLSDKAEGVYFIKFSADGESLVRKVMKE